MENNARQHINWQAEKAIANQQWSRLRFIGNRFERTGFHRNCWFILAELPEAASVEAHHKADQMAEVET